MPFHAIHSMPNTVLVQVACAVVIGEFLGKVLARIIKG